MAERTFKGCVAGVLAATAWTGAAEQAEERIEIVEVVAPLSLDADAERIAGNIQVAGAEEIVAGRALDLADFLKRNLASVFVNEAQSNPLQPDVQYRGFVGSPLLGLPQGIAIYQDAVRINEPFGDTVNWALIPQSAIAAVFLVPGSNPLFGLNALGGALSIRTKDGLSHPGSNVELSAGSFGRRNFVARTGGTKERFSYFVAVSALREDGWRDFSPTDAKRGFAKLSWNSEPTSLDFSLTWAAADLIGNGAAPVQLLTIEPTAIFTRPDRTRNELRQFTLVGRQAVSAQFSLRGNAYLRYSDIGTYNGDDSDYEACEHDPEYLCLEDDEERPALDLGGNWILADQSLEGATINRTGTGQDSAGVSIQADWSRGFDGWANRLVAGLTYDTSGVDFQSSIELGALDDTRLAMPGGVYLGDAFTDIVADIAIASLYLSDALDFGDRLRLTAAARYNRVHTILRDGLGTALDGDHRFKRLNTALGVVYRPTAKMSLYASYSESNRAPSPVELTCADPDAPCRLPNAFLADPALEQIVARTLEIGARGAAAFAWRIGWFHIRNDDDILFISAGARTSAGYFDNVGETRRKGFEISLDGGERLRWFVHGTILQATFQDAFSAPSVNHPRAMDGEIAVQPGDRLPLVPERLLKAGLTAQVTAHLAVGASLLYGSRQHVRGDEANLAPAIGAYTVFDLRADYRFHDRLSAFAVIDNALREDYATFGVFGEAEEVLGEDFKGRRFVSPGAPRGAWVGIEVQF